MKYVWIPLISIIEERQKQIANSLEDIKQSKKKQNILYKEAQTTLKQAQIKAEQIIANAYKYKSQILDTAQYEANQERDRILSQAKAQIFQEKKHVSNELRKKISQLVIQSTEKIIDKSIDKIIDQDFIYDIIKQLPTHED